MRHEFDLHGLNAERGKVEPLLKEQLGEVLIGAKYFVDDKILFWGQHFDGHDFATYSNGYKKGGSIRYREGFVRIPSHVIIPVYETKEFEASKPPRALIEIPKIVVCKAI